MPPPLPTALATLACSALAALAARHVLIRTAIYLRAVFAVLRARTAAHDALRKLRDAHTARAKAVTAAVHTVAASAAALQKTLLVSTTSPGSPDPALSIAAITRDWLALAALSAAAAASPPPLGSSYSTASRWIPDQPAAVTSILGTDIAVGVRDAVQACRSEIRLVRSASVARRVPRTMVAAASLWAPTSKAAVPVDPSLQEQD
ncbi:hypothetical protein BC828DRAFT_407817 [Blastocladiella britannica]|nr:hypothetical protein BC828DRAFT_407817 [Blastocladiella britannica]